MLKDGIIAFAKEIERKAAEKQNLEYEIYATWGDSFQVKVIGGEIDNYSVHDFIGISLRVKSDGKMGYASTTSPDEKTAGELIEKAIENAKVIESPDEQFIYYGDEKYPTPKTSEPSLMTVSAAEKIKLAKMAATLEALNPLGIIARGYSAVTDKEGNVIRSVGLLNKGDTLRVRFTDGEAEATVENLIRNGRG